MQQTFTKLIAGGRIAQVASQIRCQVIFQNRKQESVDRGLARIGKSLEKLVSREPGRVVEVVGPGAIVGCGEKAVVLLEVQPEGKRIMSGADFAHGGSARPGDVLKDPWELEEVPDG